MMHNKMKQSKDKLQNMLDQQHFQKFPTNGPYGRRLDGTNLQKKILAALLCVISFKVVHNIYWSKPCFGRPSTVHAVPVSCMRICVRRLELSLIQKVANVKMNVQHLVKTLLVVNIFYTYEICSHITLERSLC